MISGTESLIDPTKLLYICDSFDLSRVSDSLIFTRIHIWNWALVPTKLLYICDCFDLSRVSDSLIFERIHIWNWALVPTKLLYICDSIDLSRVSDSLIWVTYNPGQNCWDNLRFSPSPNYNVDFSRSPNSRSVHQSLVCFNIVWGEGGHKKGSERRAHVAHITMEACTFTVNSLLFAQNLTSVPKCFDPDCSLFLPSQCWCERFGDWTAINNIERGRECTRREQKMLTWRVPTIKVWDCLGEGM